MWNSFLLELVRLRAIVAFITFLILAVGVWRLASQKIDLYPEFAGPLIEIQTEAQGLPAAEVESLITVPLEEMLSGVPWVASMRSNSVAGVSSIVLHLTPGADLMKARQMTQERLYHASALPKVSKPPTMLQPVSVLNRSNIVGMSSESISLIEMSVLARWKVKPRLLGVPGVANVSIWGERSRQLQVLVDPAELNERSVALSEVIKATGDALWSSPLSYLQASTPGNGGFVDTPNQRFDVRHVLPISSPEDLSKITFVSAKGQKYSLGEVASVVEGHQPLVGDAIVNDKTGLMFVIEKFPGSDTASVTRGVEAAMAALAPALPGVVVDTGLYRPATYVKEARDSLATATLLSVVAALALLLLCSFDPRRTIIVGISTATTMFATIYGLATAGVNFNTITIVGLWMAAVVTINHMSGAVAYFQSSAVSGDRNLDAVASVTSRLGSSTVAMAGVMFCGFAVLSISNIVVELWQPAVVAFIAGIGVAFLVSVLVLPSLIVYLSPAQRDEPLTTSPSGRMEAWIQRKAEASLANPTSWLLIAGVASVVALAALYLLPKTFVPDFQEKNFVVRVATAPGTSLAKMRADVEKMMAAVKSVAGVTGIAAQIGRAELSDRLSDVNIAEIWVNIDDTVDKEESVAAVTGIVTKNNDANSQRVTVDSYSSMQIANLVNATWAPLEVRLHGPDDGQLGQRAEELRAALASLPGIVEPTVFSAPMEEHIEVEVKLAAAAEFGLKPGDVRRAISTLISGLQVGTLFEGQKIFDVVVAGKPGALTSIADIEKILITTPTGNAIALSQVADIRKASSANIITRRGASRYAVISAQLSGSPSAVRDAVKTAIADYAFPAGFNAELLPTQSELAGGDARLWWGIVAVLAVLFFAALELIGGWSRTLLLFVLAPAAMLGGMIAPVMEGVLSAGHIAGLAVLAALTYSGLLKVAERRGTEMKSTKDAAGAAGGPVPGMLTAAAAIIGVAAGVIIKGETVGLELLHPMSVVIVLGLPTVLAYLAVVAPAAVKSTVADKSVDVSLQEKGRAVHASA